MQKTFRPLDIVSCQCIVFDGSCLKPDQQPQKNSWLLKSNKSRRRAAYKKKSLKQAIVNKRNQQLYIEIPNHYYTAAKPQLETQKIFNRNQRKNQYCYQSLIIPQITKIKFVKFQSQQCQRNGSPYKPKITFNLYDSKIQNCTNKNTILNGEHKKNINKIGNVRKSASVAKKSQIEASSQKKSQFVQVKCNESSSFIFQNKELIQNMSKLNRVNTLDPKLIQSQRDSDEQSQQMSEVLMHYSPSIQNPQTNDESHLINQAFEKNAKIWDKFLSN